LSGQISGRISGIGLTGYPDFGLAGYATKTVSGAYLIIFFVSELCKNVTSFAYKVLCDQPRRLVRWTSDKKIMVKITNHKILK
jgi:hypothetical protein